MDEDGVNFEQSARSMTLTGWQSISYLTRDEYANYERHENGRKALESGMKIEKRENPEKKPNNPDVV